MTIYISPHNTPAAEHQREVDRRAIRDRARELFAEDALRELMKAAEPLNDALLSHNLICQLEKLLIDASDAIAESRIKQLEGCND